MRKFDTGVFEFKLDENIKTGDLFVRITRKSNYELVSGIPLRDLVAFFDSVSADPVGDVGILGLNQSVRVERKRCYEIAMDQAFFPDTKTGTRQGWVKAEIARKIMEG